MSTTTGIYDQAAMLTQHKQTQLFEVTKLTQKMCLHTRRIRSDLIDTYKIINGIYNVNTELFF